MKKKRNSAKIRDLARTRHEILEAAFGEVFTRGFQGVSVDDIVKKTKLTKGAFYHQFPKKLDLGYALVDEVIKPLTYARWVEPLKKYDNPLDGILKQMQLLIGDADAKSLRYGCPLNNLVQEMAPVDAGFKKRLQSAILYWVQGIELELIRAKKQGYLKRDTNPKQVAIFIVMAHEGFYGILKGLNGPGAFAALYDSLEKYFSGLRVN